MRTSQKNDAELQSAALSPVGGMKGSFPADLEAEREKMQANTALIQRWLNAAVEESAGTVVIPPGTYWVRTLVIPKYTELQVSSAATLRAWPFLEDYRPTEAHRRDADAKPASDRATDHWDVFGGYTLIYAHGAEGIALTGRGKIDGSGFAFWDIPLRDYIAQGGTREELNLRSHWEDDSPFWRQREPRLHPLVQFEECSRVLVRDITLANSAGWTLHPFCCDDVTVEHITIDNHLYGPNTDGIDIDGCRDAAVRGCRIRCADDAVILKSTRHGRSCERVSVSDCFIETHCAAVGLGAEVAHPIRDVSVGNITVGRALRMVQIELWDAGLVENVVISGMTGANMTDIPLERPLYIDIQHHGRTDGQLGAVRNVQLRGVSAVTRGRCLFTAADGAAIEGLIVDGLQLTIPEIEDPQQSVLSSRSSQMSNDSPQSRAVRAALVLDNVRDAQFRDIQIRWPDRDRSDRARSLRQSFDRGRLNEDRRKQEALEPDPPMHALFLRNCEEVTVVAPTLRGYRKEVLALGGTNTRCSVESADSTGGRDHGKEQSA